MTPGKNVTKFVIVTNATTGGAVTGLIGTAFTVSAWGQIYSGTPAPYSITPTVTEMGSGCYAIQFALPAAAGFGGADVQMVSSSYAARPVMYSGEVEVVDLTALYASILRQVTSASAVTGLGQSLPIQLVPYRYYTLSWTITGVDLTQYSNFCLAFRDQTQKARKVDLWFAAKIWDTQAAASGAQGNLTITGTSGGAVTITLPRSLVGPHYTTWLASTAYKVGDCVAPVTPNGFLYVCKTAGTSSGSAPTWPTTENGTVTDGTITWVCLAQSVWLASTAHAKGDYVTPQLGGTPDFGGVLMRCVTAGVTGSSEPVWGTTPSNPESVGSEGYITDGTCKWQVYNDFYQLLTEGASSAQGFWELTGELGTTGKRVVLTPSSTVTLSRWEVGT